MEGVVAHRVRSYKGRKAYGKHPPLTPALSSLLKAAAIHGRSPRAPEGRGRSGGPRRNNNAALSPLRYGALRGSGAARGSKPPIRLASVGRRFYPSYRYEPFRPFSLGYFSLTPGILPSALRAGFAVRTRSKRVRGPAKEK